MLKIKIRKLLPQAQLPMKMSAQAAGYDLCSANLNDIVLEKKQIKLIPTGLSISLPAGFEAQIRPRSGLAIRNGIGILNSPGTIDADYRGEIKIILINLGDEDFVISPGMRIAQMIVSRHEELKFDLTEELDDTERGKGGFGHTKV